LITQESHSEEHLEVILFAAGNEFFALPLDSVREALDDVDSVYVPDMAPHLAAVANAAGRTIPLYRSDAFLGVVTTTTRPAVLMLKGGDADAGLAVDALLGSVSVPLSSINRVPGLEDASGAFKGVFFRDGRLFTLLNPAALLRQQEHAATEGGQ
jgi:chemotaxis signal transduction protein